MLFDPKWQSPAKAESLSLACFVRWLERQPAQRSYEYQQPDGCLVAQWLKATAPERDHLLAPEEVGALFGGNGDRIVLGDEILDLCDPVRNRTFGAALARARAVLADSSITA